MDSDLIFTDISVKRKQDCLPNTLGVKKFNMGRSSKGNTGNESRNLAKFMPNWSLDSWLAPKESLRMAKTPSSFAEASVLAKSWYSLRNKRSADHPSISKPRISPVPVPAFEFDKAQLSIQTDSSTGSPCNYLASSVSSMSPTLSLMSHVGNALEGSLSVRLLELTVDEDKPSTAND